MDRSQIESDMYRMYGNLIHRTWQFVAVLLLVTSCARAADESPRAVLARARTFSEQQPDAALAAYRMVRESHKDSPEAAVAIFESAQLQHRLGRDREAHDLLQQLLTRKPPIQQLDAVFYQLAWVFISLEQPKKANEVFERLRRDHPTSDYWADAVFRLAEQASKQGDVQAATGYLDELLPTKPEPRLQQHGLYLKGQLAAQQQKWSDVIGPMQQVVDEFPNGNLRLPARYWIAEAAFRLGNYGSAHEQFGDLSKDIRDEESSWVPMVPLRQSQCLAHEEKWGEALELARGVRALFPEFRQVYEADYVIGRCLTMQARFSESREAFARVLRSTTGGKTETAAMAQWMIGESYFHQQKHHDAIRAYGLVVTRHAFPRWQAAALLQAGKCHEQAGEWQDAVKMYTKLLSDYPNTEYATAASQRLRVARKSVTSITN